MKRNIIELTLNELVTEADRLYRAMEDGDAYEDTQDFLDDAKDFLDVLINKLEAMGAAVDGVQYQDNRHLK